MWWLLVFLLFIPDRSWDKMFKLILGFVALYYFAEFTEWLWAIIKGIFV